MKLWQAPRNTWVVLPGGDTVLFHKMDGMYGQCTDDEGGLHLIFCGADVELLSAPDDQPPKDTK